MNEIDRLDTVLGELEQVVAGVRPDQRGAATACDEFTVGKLVDHIVGYLQNFAAAAQGLRPSTDPAQVHSLDPVADVHAARGEIVDGWRRLGVDRNVVVTRGDGSPGAMVLGMTLIEYVTHGTELALATGQGLPFSDEEYEAALALAESSVTDDYRGPGMPFGPRVQPGPAASAAERLMAFMGRRTAAPA